MAISAYLSDIPKPVWIGVMVFGFIWHWPIGLAVLAYLIGSKRIGQGSMPGRWYNTQANGNGARRNCWTGKSRRHASGNAAFDDYRTETIRRLEDEQKEFVEYLERLRQAKDKAEFDQFMADRRRPVPTENT